MRNRYLVALMSVSILFPSAVFSQTARTLTWDACVKEAEKKNPDLISARETVLQQESAVGITRSPLLPQISATASGKKTHTGGNGVDTTSNSYSYGITGRQLIFDGFKSWYDLKGESSRLDAARMSYIASSATIRYNLRTAFVALLKAQQMLSLTKEIETRRKHNLDLVRLRYEAGSEHRGSYYAAKADYAQAQADVASAEREIGTARRTLASLIGADSSEQFTASGSIALDTKYETDPAVEKLAVNHPSVKMMELRKNAARSDATASKLDFSPQLYGFANAGKSGDTLAAKSTTWSIGVEASAPLFEGGRTYYSMTKAQSAYRQADADEKSTHATVLTAIGKSWNALKDSIENVNVQKEYLNAALERSKIGEAQYSIGLLSFDNWTILETNLVNAKKSYLSACAQALSAEAEWIQSIGGPLEYETQN